MIEIVSIEQAPAFGHWTEPKDALPEPGQKCLCQCRSGITEVLTYDREGFNTYGGNKSTRIDVDVWMPLPPFWEGE